MPASAHLNLERLSGIVSGNPSIMLEILHLSAPLNDVLLARLVLALSAHEWNEAREVAHTLKGAFVNIGADKLSELCGFIYDALGTNDYERARRTATVLDLARSRLARAVNTYEQACLEGNGTHAKTCVDAVRSSGQYGSSPLNR